MSKKPDLKNTDLDPTKEYPTSVTSKLGREKLPEDLQDLVNKQDDFLDQLYEGDLGPSTDSNLRFAAYANRIRTIMLSAHRYVAYTSDIGESFRPVAHPWLVRSTYGISWAYLIGDVSHEGYKAYRRNAKLLEPLNHEHTKAAMDMVTPQGAPVQGGTNGQPMHIPAIEDWRAVVAQRAVFQSIASMGLPAFTIHSIVKYSGKAFKTASNTVIRTWGPIGLGLAAVPALPYMFDEPVEHAVEWTFYNAFKAIGGEKAVAPSAPTGREDAINKQLQVAQELKKRQ